MSGSLDLMLTGKNELTQGGLNERKLGGNQLYQAVSGWWLVYQPIQTNVKK